MVAAHRIVKWKSPSLDEGPARTVPDEAVQIVMPSDVEAPEFDAVPAPVQGGRNRGLVMHKLFEEVLNGETADGVEALTTRASALIAELGEDVSANASDGL